MPVSAHSFETAVCTRCGGSGWYSYCQTWGNTCFQCGIKPHAQGLGRHLTHRGRAAYDYYLSLLPRRHAADLQPGELILMDGKRTVSEIVNPTSSARIMPDGSRVYSGVDIVTPAITFLSVPADEMVLLVPTPEQRAKALRQALEYQVTLTKQGKPWKRQRSVLYA